MNTTATALRNFGNEIGKTAVKAANEKSLAYKETETFLVATAYGHHEVGAPVEIARHNYSTAGAIIQDGNKLHTMIEKGKGMFVVQSKDGTNFLTRDGAWQINALDQLENTARDVLLGAPYVDGVAPTSVTPDDLVPVSFLGAADIAEATTKISIGVRLKADQELIRGPGDKINIQKNANAAGLDSGSFYAASENSVIVPGVNSQLGELNLGDQFTLQTADQANATIFEYGGIATSKQISANYPMYGVTDAGTQFQFGVGGNLLLEGAQFVVTIGNSRTYTFTASGTSTDAKQGRFGSLAQLKEAINAASDNNLIAEIANDTLYITSNDANQSLTFSNGNTGGNLVSVLGTDPVAQANGTYRFSTIKDAKQKIHSIDGLRAKVAGVGVEFGGEDAGETLALKPIAQHKRTAYRAYTGGITYTNVDVKSANRLVTIGLNRHGFSEGDFVHIKGFQPNIIAGGGNVEDGIYEVVGVSNTGDSFSIAPRIDLFARTDAGDAAAAAAVGNLAVLDPTVGFTVQKVNGNIVSQTTAAAAATTTAIVTAPGGGAYVTLTIAFAANFAASENMAIGDTVYITGSTILANGYYKLTAVTANSITVSAPTTARQGGGAALAVAAAAPDVATTFTKVSSVAGTPYDPLPIQLGGVGSSLVTVNAGIGHNHVVGDILSFNMAASVVYNGITLIANQYYTITASNPGAGTITFDSNEGQTPPLPNSATAAGCAIGFNSNYNSAGGGGAGVLTQQVGGGAPITTLGADAYINYAGREMKALGMKNTTAALLNSPLAATYNPTDILKNFASGGIKPAFTVSATVITSLGIPETVTFGFGKLSSEGQQSEWAVEIYVKPDKNGDLPINGTNPQLANGKITFDGKGNLTDVGTLSNAITAQWKDGAEQGSFVIDWGAIGGVDLQGNHAAAVVKQVSDLPHSIENFMHNNGTIPGTIVDHEISSEGIVSVTYSTGRSRKLFMVPLGTVDVQNSLSFMGLGRYQTNFESGNLVLRFAGANGLSPIISGATEGSNVHSAANMIEAGAFVAAYGASAKILEKDREVRQMLLSAV